MQEGARSDCGLFALPLLTPHSSLLTPQQQMLEAYYVNQASDLDVE
jgi:hypothetical protein